MTFPPDSYLATGEIFGYLWWVRHNFMGYRNGYVDVPEGHPWFGEDYHDIHANVHGGLTFAQANDNGAWTIGFDCAHLGDQQDTSLPYQTIIAGPSFPEATIKDDRYVAIECIHLCLQARDAYIDYVASKESSS